MYKNSDYLAIDPGLTSGWATFNDQGVVIDLGQFKYEERNNVLKDLIHENLKEVIVEDYRNHGFTQQKRWSRNETSKLIGVIETYCTIKNVPIVLQPNTVKAIGYKWAGIKPPSNHSISHQYDAVAHGTYRLQQTGIRKPGLAIKEEDK